MRRIHQFFGFRCVHPFNVDVQLRFDTKTGWQRANPHFAFNKGVFWQSEFVASRNELHCAQEAGGVARSEQLFRVGYFTPHAAHLFWHTQFDIQNAIGRRGAAITASGCFGFGSVDNFF